MAMLTFGISQRGSRVGFAGNLKRIIATKLSTDEIRVNPKDLSLALEIGRSAGGIARHGLITIGRNVPRYKIHVIDKSGPVNFKTGLRSELAPKIYG